VPPPIVLILPLLLHPFNGLFSRTTWVSRYQKGETSLDLNEARDGGVLGRTGISWTICKQICTSLQTDNYTNTSSFNFYRADALPGAQPTVSKHRRHSLTADNKSDITGNTHCRMCSVQSCKAGYAVHRRTRCHVLGQQLNAQLKSHSAVHSYPSITYYICKKSL